MESDRLKKEIERLVQKRGEKFIRNKILARSLSPGLVYAIIAGKYPHKLNMRSREAIQKVIDQCR